jgi:flavorubredoxin
MITLYDADGHINIMFNDLTSGEMVQANQHVIIDGKEALLIDPGGHKVYTNLISQLASLASVDNLKHIFFSHQDPDIIAAANGWLMLTDATAYLSALWMRFIPHFGVDDLVVKRITPIPDEGIDIALNGKKLQVIPAHFLHSPGNFQLYDPVAKILYSGDLGASLGCDYHKVEDFAKHIQYMEPFHKRYMAGSTVLQMWARTVKELEIDMIVPQHGAIFGDPETAAKFIGWVESLKCGLDLLQEGLIFGS